MLSDNEIIKALECCDNDKQCTECPMNDSYPFCDDVIGGIALDLINRLQAENETLKSEFRKELEEHEAFTLKAKAEIENERLKGKVEELSDVLSDTIRIRYAEAKAEGYKEFAERVKEENFDRCIDVVYDGSGEVKRTEIRQTLFNKQIDNLLKELVGEDK